MAPGTGEGSAFELPILYFTTTKIPNAIPAKTINSKHQPQHPPDRFLSLISSQQTNKQIEEWMYINLL